MSNAFTKAILAILLLSFAAGVALFIWKSEPGLNPNFENEGAFFKDHSFHLGLDLSGGTHLVYEADTSVVSSDQVDDSMEALRDIIERRVNLFGVSEPVVQVQKSSAISGAGEQLIVDLPGVTDVKQATDMIGQTPLLEFKIEAPEGTPVKATVDENGQVVLDPLTLGREYVNTELTGRYLERASLIFDPTTRQPYVNLKFNEEGSKLFAAMTKENIGKTIAIYLDGAPISAPRVDEEIPTGEAVISGSFTPIEARQLVGRLNSGALPVPISLLSTQTIGATLGDQAVDAGVRSAIIGYFLVAIFLILRYRLPGLVATMALFIFVLLMLAIFKLLPVTLTAAGIAGFIISIGIAVDANVLIFERIKEELLAGKSVAEAVTLGFSRAWSSIRDSSTSNLITAVILFWFGTSLIKGFAMTLGIGVVVSLFSAITVTRVFLNALSFVGNGKVARFLFLSGLSK
jgi:preprotein translocase subunit SecD